MSESYRRYLTNGIREKLNLGGVAIKLETVGKVSQTLQERMENKNKK